MNNQKIASFDQHSVNQTLNDLIQVDIDTYHVYNQAAKKAKDKELKNLLLELAASHEEHINTLSKIVLERGGHPTSFSRDFKGFVTSGYTSIKVSGGKLRTLEAIETNEIISNRYYEKALTVTMPRKIKDTLRKNLQDEERHLNLIHSLQGNLKNK